MGSETLNAYVILKRAKEESVLWHVEMISFLDEILHGSFKPYAELIFPYFGVFADGSPAFYY
jgi:hypothetical protein